MLTILVVFAYYLISMIGLGFARQGTISPWAGVWLADFIFALAGAFLLWRAGATVRWNSRRYILRGIRCASSSKRSGVSCCAAEIMTLSNAPLNAAACSAPASLCCWTTYILRDFFVYMLLITSSFLMLLLVFTVFDLLGDILRNQISPLIVGAYLLNVVPSFFTA